ncbi:hypothetical protein; putative exported protein [Escherichia fergusonii ATCC 35469]|uniref:Uncharacterized protein n=1 Tax=Escherichia fergusonii (strain ATCC 35469 / DSM 13698 / CCUG 18766 / IAM 14443 / JCM 21226 / LMG 7866 / NBRC 102419 / NCTC 12128 / CDC 0568-73) TaxID=585054 RepID=B7LQH3_ESCF3|nr:hypothetical protein; putative exported protein [Escherichia fergusonii ATCC 35469]
MIVGIIKLALLGITAISVCMVLLNLILHGWSGFFFHCCLICLGLLASCLVVNKN